MDPARHCDLSRLLGRQFRAERGAGLVVLGANADDAMRPVTWRAMLRHPRLGWQVMRLRLRWALQGLRAR